MDRSDSRWLKQRLSKLAVWAADVVAQTAEADAQFATSVGHGDLVPIGYGASSVVFAAPRKGRVVRVTTDTVLSECSVIESLLGRKRVGWPRVYDLVNVDTENPARSGRPVCVAVVERVTPTTSLRRGKKRDDIMNAAFMVDDGFPDNITNSAMYDNASERSRKWARQLDAGLRAINRQIASYNLDLCDEGNWGLDDQGSAVWIDFGV